MQNKYKNLSLFHFLVWANKTFISFGLIQYNARFESILTCLMGFCLLRKVTSTVSVFFNE